MKLSIVDLLENVNKLNSLTFLRIRLHLLKNMLFKTSFFVQCCLYTLSDIRKDLLRLMEINLLTDYARCTQNITARSLKFTLDELIVVGSSYLLVLSARSYMIFLKLLPTKTMAIRKSILLMIS